VSYRISIPEGQLPELFGALTHIPEFKADFVPLYREIFHGGSLEVSVIEALRLRVAKQTECGL
jgi:hypothetical protein